MKLYPPEPVLAKLIKKFELNTQSMTTIPSNSYLVVRLDGRAFHTFTQGLNKPFDENLTTCMIETVSHLVEKLNPIISFYQSDEITLMFKVNMLENFMFGGRTFKILSILSAMTSVKFNQQIVKYLPNKADSLPHFDCRLMSFNTFDDAILAIIWRQQDCIKNSISMIAQAFIPHKFLLNKSNSEKIKILSDIGVNVSDYPETHLSGFFFTREVKDVILSEDELLKIPTKHRPKDNIARRSYTKVFSWKDLQHIDSLTIQQKLNVL